MIGFLSKDDPRKVNGWSGTHHFLFKSLEQNIGRVEPVGAVYPRRLWYYKIKAKIWRKLAGKNHKHEYEPSLAKAYARRFDQIVKQKRETMDFIFSSLTLPEIGFMQTDIPIIATADASFLLLKDYYPGHSNLTHRTEKNAYRLEKAGLEKARYLVYPSQWAANSAVEDYDISPDKIIVQPYGANLNRVPDQQQVEAAIERRMKNKELKLLFIGKDWYRKGGALAYQIKEQIKREIGRARLIVCGCVPPKQYTGEDVKVYSFLDKNDPSELEQLIDLYNGSHFFVLPTRNECLGMVYNEASAHGLPVLTSDTGGVPTIVESDQNGYLFSVDAEAEEYAEKIIELWEDPSAYRALCLSTRRRYEKHLNWDTWGERVRQVANRL